MSIRSKMSRDGRLLMNSLTISLSMAFILFVIHILNIFSGWNLGVFGIRPRDTDFWFSIFTGQLIHGDFQHLLSNTIPLIICGTLLFWLYRPIAWTSFILLYVLTGLSVWILARPVLHIGFSGVIYGLVSFLFWVGVFRRDFRSIIISLVILVTYSGYFAGIYPNQEGISWESHLLGGVVGIIVAFILFRWLPKEPEPEVLPEDEPEDQRYFLPRNTFQPKDDEFPDVSGWTSDDTR